MFTFNFHTIDLPFLKECVDSVLASGKYKPEVLIISKQSFIDYKCLWSMGGVIDIKDNARKHFNEFKKLGIKRIVWMEDLPDNEFELCSGKGLEEGIETIYLDKDSL